MTYKEVHDASEILTKRNKKMSKLRNVRIIHVPRIYRPLSANQMRFLLVLMDLTNGVVENLQAHFP
jgi:hypothetical protein